MLYKPFLSSSQRPLMSTPPSGSSSNVLDSIPLQGRKRQRSQSMQSDSAASTSSVKRSTADNSSADTRGRSPLTDQPQAASVSPDPSQDIDSYMAASGALHIPPIVSPPSYQEIAVQPVSLEEKYQIVQKGKDRKMEVGETWFLVSRVWYKRWRKVCTGQIDKEGPVTENELGPLDNSDLLDSFGNLRPSLAEGVDVEFVPQEVWDLFVQWWVICHFI